MTALTVTFMIKQALRLIFRSISQPHNQITTFFDIFVLNSCKLHFHFLILRDVNVLR